MRLASVSSIATCVPFYIQTNYVLSIQNVNVEQSRQYILSAIPLHRDRHLPEIAKNGV